MSREQPNVLQKTPCTRRVPFNALIFIVLLLLGDSARAQTYTVLHAFTGSDGASPQAVIRDSAGTLYGTAATGGAYGSGTVFKLDPSGALTVLHAFGSVTNDGIGPSAPLTLDGAGHLVSTTYTGGTFALGTVFWLTPQGKYAPPHSFSGIDGCHPVAALTRDEGNNLYGTTNCGGSYGYGTVFKLDRAANVMVLHSFTDNADGSYPSGGLVRDSDGNLYGTTSTGGKPKLCQGFGCGVVFKLDPSSNLTVLYTFRGAADGSFPDASLIRDAAGNLYGTTLGGGNKACNCGVVFKLDPSGNEAVLHRFTGGPDGANPRAGLVRDGAGNLFGTTQLGGDTTCLQGGCGVVFKLDRSGHETILHSFTGGTDGAESYGALFRDRGGNLYGATFIGGNAACNAPYGCGVLFKIAF
ncbi:MAG TPA: choice-of-anchor tandem repeat GloVer-containing protein [Terriglobales bacterium]|nr:choice-of-anchor tandem repeat GloVer-containing protein [Terriglobales bacterium]